MLADYYNQCFSSSVFMFTCASLCVQTHMLVCSSTRTVLCSGGVTNNPCGFCEGFALLIKGQ